MFHAHAQDEADHEEENYFVSMTDMMVGLLFIFIIMLMAFALNFSTTRDDHSTQIAEVQATINRLTETVERIEEDVVAMRRVDETRRWFLDQLEKRLKAVGVAVQWDPGSDVLRLPEQILFDSDRSVLAPKGIDAVRQLTRVLQDLVPCFNLSVGSPRPHECPPANDVRLESLFIEGHADATGSPERNWTLSAERSIATYRQMEATSRSLTETRNNNGAPMISISAYSSNRPVVVGARTREEHAQNRRIDLRVIMQASHQEALVRIQSELKGIRDQLEMIVRSTQ